MIIHEKDNVEIRSDGHKYARCNISCGEKVIKYGMPIGSAVSNISCGEHVHTHNCKTDLSGILEYTYTPDFSEIIISRGLKREICSITFCSVFSFEISVT